MFVLLLFSLFVKLITTLLPFSLALFHLILLLFFSCHVLYLLAPVFLTIICCPFSFLPIFVLFCATHPVLVLHLALHFSASRVWVFVFWTFCSSLSSVALPLIASCSQHLCFHSPPISHLLSLLASATSVFLFSLPPNSPSVSCCPSLKFTEKIVEVEVTNVCHVQIKDLLLQKKKKHPENYRGGRNV